MSPYEDARQVPLTLTTDLNLGGRWVSLISNGSGGLRREWLWKNPDTATAAARRRVGPQSAFVDAGGGEECYPSVRAPYDHGLIWNRSWERLSDGEVAEAEGYRLHRHIAHSPDGLTVEYAASADTFRPAIHATHLLLDLSPDTTLHPASPTNPTFIDQRPRAEIEELGGEQAFVRALGSGAVGAVCYVLPGCRTVRVVDGADVLELSLNGPSELPLGFIVWRNLGAWPEGDPYRSIGIEPSLGYDVSFPSEHDGGSVTVGPEPARWTLNIRALERPTC